MTLYSDLTKGTHARLRVDKERSRENFFTVVTDDPYDTYEEFTLPKLKFQKNENVPDYLDIYVKEAKDGYVIIGQDLSVIIPKFYKEGEEYLFRIKGKKIGKPGAYEVEDDNGLYFTLNKAPEGLARGKVLKCKVVKMSKMFVFLKYSGLLAQKIKLQFRDLRSWLSVINQEVNTKKVKLFLSTIPDLSPALEQLENSDPDWIFTALHIFSQNVTKFFIDTKGDKTKMNFIRETMKMAIDICLYIIQKSDYLRACNADQRAELQETLSGYVEMFRQYEEAADLISNNEDESFIDDIFENLKQAGFLYHPSEKFRIMMTILRLRPDLIKSRLTNMFDALHSWPMSNWRVDPFRSALVDQLEIYISENCEHLNSVPMSETQNGIDNKQLTHIIRSIAIQSLLTLPSDKIDISHNKSMFYRFLSNFRIQDVDDLLYKAVGSILGNDYKGDFSWEDTSKFQLLQEKASAFKGSNIDLPLPPKVYALQNATIELRPKELTVKERYASDDNSVLPNGLISWMSPRILLSERVRTPNATKKNDLKAYEEMWGNIENCLFPESDPNATNEVEIRKRRPEDGEPVDIIIDGCSIDPTRSEGHRLRFHCVVVNEDLEGSGWLTSCPEDFVPWLDEKDVPRNYDSNIELFCDDRGIPLVLPAVVKNSGSEELYFSMKTEIDNHLEDMVELQEETQAVIRKDESAKKRYICLSDKGYTLIVYYDDNNRGYQPGSVVKVRYIGRNQERSYPFRTFMEGEIIECVRKEDYYSKVPPLRSIIQSLGHVQEGMDDSAASEVVEAQEVMSREEMREVILMLQRRAYAEKEYLQAFNYLGLAALLAKGIEDLTLREEIKLHQKLLAQLQYYARNREVNREELNQHKEEVKGNPILQKLYTKLDIVASISRPERNTRLWELTTQEDETERLLASLVLSLNLLPEEDSYETVRKGINSQIAKMLNVNSTETNLKYYGEEDQHMEFKSSLVFTNRKEDHMAANRRAQEREILEIICGFLNSQGGTLYIGVNDLGYEAGLAEDLRYRRSRGRKATLDGMIVDLEALIHRSLDGYAQDHIRIASDPEAQKGVIAVSVDAVERPVYLDGTIYVRHSTSTRPKLDKDLDDFLAMRSRDFADFMARQREAYEEQQRAREEEERLASDKERREREKDEAEALRSVSSSRKSTSDGEDDTTPRSDTNPVQETPEVSMKVQTGIHRLNLLHDYDLGFVHPACYLHFNTDNTFYLCDEDQYNEFEDDKRIVLAIAEGETDQMLITTFADGTVCRTPIDELMEIDRGRKIEHWSESEIKAVNIGSKDKLLLTFLVNINTNTLFVRADEIEDLTISHKLKNGGKKLFDGEYRILRQDVCSAEWANQHFPKIIENSKKLYGSIVRFTLSNETYDERIDYFVKLLEAERTN